MKLASFVTVLLVVAAQRRMFSGFADRWWSFSTCLVLGIEAYLQKIRIWFCVEMQVSREIRNMFWGNEKKYWGEKGRVEIPVFARIFNSGRDYLATSTTTEINFTTKLTKNWIHSSYLPSIRWAVCWITPPLISWSLYQLVQNGDADRQK